MNFVFVERNREKRNTMLRFVRWVFAHVRQNIVYYSVQYIFFLLFSSLLSTHQFNRIDNAGFLCALHIWTACICWCANSQRREKINRKKNLKYIISALVKVAQPINYPVNRLNRHSAARSMHANKLKHSLNIEKFIIL